VDLLSFEAMRDELQPIIDKLWRHCEASTIRGRTVVLKVKFSDFQTITRSRTLAAAVESREELERVSLDLLGALMPVRKGVRLLGVTLAGLDLEDAPADPQMSLAL
jgi:DNA polymerase-4